MEDKLVEERWANPVRGIEWSSMFRRIVQYYSGRLELIQLGLNVEDGLSIVHVFFNLQVIQFYMCNVWQVRRDIGNERAIRRFRITTTLAKGE